MPKPLIPSQSRSGCPHRRLSYELKNNDPETIYAKRKKMPKSHSSNPDSLDPKLLLQVLTAVKNGDFSVRLPVEWTGLDGKIADTFNDIIALNEKLAQETERISKVVGKEGKIGHRIVLGRVDGAWANQVENINSLVTDLATPPAKWPASSAPWPRAT